MSDDLSPVLSLPLIQPAQAQKHVTHNEALRLLDVLVQPAVASRSTLTPPANPAPGTRYIVPAGALGAWAGQDGTIAFAEGGGWAHLVPLPGWQAWVADEGTDALFDGTAWTTPAERAARVARLGVGTDADATNRLAVAAPATLLTHDGAGHQLKINKAASTDTASLLFQTGWSGRAEIGTTGSDALAVKVSADGTAWVTALALDAATGLATGAAVTQTASDATPGRLTRTGDFGLGTLNPRGGGLMLADWLSTVEPTGFHHLGNDTETANKPAGISGAGWGSALTVRTSDSIGARIGWRGFRNATEFFMQKWDSGGWGVLLKFFNNRNIVGTVVNAGGVPDGAIVETGSNANGRYTRFADGTQICWRTMTASASAGVTWTFPAAFSAAPAVTGSAVATVLSAVCLDAAPGATSATLSARDKADARRADVIHLRAEGRWF